MRTASSPPARFRPLATRDPEEEDGAMAGTKLFESGLGFGPANFTPLTLVAFLPRTAAVHPDRVAVIHGDRRFTYRDFYARARRLASALTAHGIRAVVI